MVPFDDAGNPKSDQRSAEEVSRVRLSTPSQKNTVRGAPSNSGNIHGERATGTINAERDAGVGTLLVFLKQDLALEAAIWITRLPSVHSALSDRVHG
jgi:hypothetical protein